MEGNYLTEEEANMVQEQFVKDIEQKEEKNEDHKALYEMQIKGHENQIEKLTKELKVAELALELYKENPMPANPQFEYEKDPRFIEAVKPLNIAAIEEKIALTGKPLESSLFQIELLKIKLSLLDEKKE